LLEINFIATFLYFLVIQYIFTMISEIKLSPLLLFFTLLIVLVIATTVKRWGLVSEGFIGYLKDTDSFSSQTVKAYDSKNNIIKLYDDIFYDHRNGNAILITASPYVSTADTTGTTVSSIDVIPRKMDPIYTYSKGSDNANMSQQCPESKITTIESLEIAWSIKSEKSMNQLNYITWGNDTYLYVMDLSLSNTTITGNTTTTGSYVPAVTAYFNGSMKQSTNSYSASDAIALKPAFTYTSDGKDDTNVVEDFYDKTQTAYQLVSGVWFDVKNGNLLIKTNGTSAKLDVFTRGSKTPSYTYTAPTTGTTPASQISFSQSSVAPYFIQDGKGDHTIMYWANGDNTVLAVFRNMLESTGTIRAVKCRRFTRDGLYSSGTGDKDDDKKTKDEIKIDTTGENKDILDAFARWYIYFNTNAVGSGNSDDYLLKTQIVPPVCPACPGCKGVCTDCGGKGGSGTKTSESSSLAFDTKTVVGATGSAVANTVGATGEILGKTVDTAGNVVGKTVDVAGNVVGKTLDTAGNVVNKTVDTAGNILGSTASALGLDRIGYQQSYGGPVNTSSTNTSGYPSAGYSQSEYRPGSNTTGVAGLPNSKPNDPYSYNGALQSKGGNFMAVTADFSRFGR
jgi:hypothetical protein